MVGDILQPTHLLFILVVALLVLGPKRLPEVGKSLGNGLRDFRAAMSFDDTKHEEISRQVSSQTTPSHTTVFESTQAGQTVFESTQASHAASDSTQSSQTVFESTQEQRDPTE